MCCVVLSGFFFCPFPLPFFLQKSELNSIYDFVNFVFPAAIATCGSFFGPWGLCLYGRAKGEPEKGL